MSDSVYIYKLLAYYCLLMQRYDIMGYGGGIYDHFGKEHEERMEELERRERDLERRERELERDERELEKREKRHEREDEMYRRGWFGERNIRDEYEGTEPYMRRGRRSRYY